MESDDMKRFVRRAVQYCTVVLVLLGGIRTYNLFSVTSPAQWEGPSTLVLGDSHARRGIDPSFLPNGVSWAMNAEPYVLTYLKSQVALDTLPNLKLVVLSLSPHNISSFNDQKFVDGTWAKSMFTILYPLGNPDLLAGLPYDKNRWRIVRLHNLWLAPRRDHTSRFRGKYVADDTTRLDESDVSVPVTRHFQYQDYPTNISQIALENLFRTVRLLISADVEVLIVSLPLHSDYRDLIPPIFREAHKAAIQGAREIGANTIDLTELELNPAEYRDHDHLTHLGAHRVGRLIREKIDAEIPRVSPHD